MIHVPGSPFGVVVTPDGRWAFVALINSVEVLRLGPALAPVPVRTIAVTKAAASPGGPADAVGETLTPDGR